MQTALSRIWTHFAVSIFYDGDHYTTGTPYIFKHQNKLLTPILTEAVNQLFNNPDITIHMGDKTNIYIILDKTDYNKKLKIVSITKQNSKTHQKPHQPTSLKNTLTKLSQPITQKFDF